MPAVLAPSGDYYSNQIAKLWAAINAMARQQNFGVVDGGLTARIQGGLQEDGTYSITALDSSGNVRATLGELPNGDFGMLVVDPGTGQQTEILPVYETDIDAFENTSSTTYTDLATPGPLVTATVGARGDVIVAPNTYVGTSSSPSSINAGYVGISVDGAPPSGLMDELLYVSISTGTSATGIALNTSASVILTGLTPGVHTFEMKYKAAGGTATFGNRNLQIRPI